MSSDDSKTTQNSPGTVEKEKEHLFKPGQSGNPGGRPKMPSDVLEGRKLNQIEVARIFNEFSNYSYAQLKNIVKDEQTNTLELLIGRIMVEAIKTGDHSRMNFILDRMIGKVADKTIVDANIKTAGISIQYVVDSDDENKPS